MTPDDLLFSSANLNPTITSMAVAHSNCLGGDEQAEDSKKRKKSLVKRTLVKTALLPMVLTNQGDQVDSQGTVRASLQGRICFLVIRVAISSRCLPVFTFL